MSLRLVFLHALSLILPATAVGFVLTGPHPTHVAIGWLAVPVLFFLIDFRSPPSLSQPPEALPQRAFDALLVVHVLTQTVAIFGLAWLAGTVGVWSADFWVGSLIVGLNSGGSAIVVAHELVHRRSKHWRRLGRYLLATVLYEHFYTEHVRGHHRRVGTPEDPATARYGESYGEFFARTVEGQFRSAWRLETKRLGDVDMALTDRRLLKSRVVHGLIGQAVLVIALTAAFGWAALLAFCIQRTIAVRLLEAVNYFEHWGLARQGKRVGTQDSWDADSWWTRFTLVGLSRHADHHAHAARPYSQLRHFDDSPKLPNGYMAMVLRVFFDNRALQQELDDELRRTGLGPYAEAAAAK